MERLILIPALLLAFVTLRGWPIELGFWLRTFVALASLATAFATIALLAPTPHAPRFKNRRKPSVLDRIAGGTAITLSLVALYFVLVLGPIAANRLSFILVPIDEIQLEDLEEGEVDWDPSASEEMQFFTGEVHTEVRTTFDPDGAQVPTSANLSLTDKPEVSLKLLKSSEARRLHASGPIYISSFAHDFFDGEHWKSHVTNGSQILLPERDGRILLRSPNQSSVYRYTVLQGKRFDNPNTAAVLQGAVYLRLPEITRSAPATYLLPELDPETDHFQYEAGSSPKVFMNLVKRKLPLAAGTIDQAYQLPTSDPQLDALIKSIADQFDDSFPLETQLQELQHWLRGTYSYSLLINYPDNGKSALENFLENRDTGKGFCVHFASAAALLTRKMGIPSRICFGWTGGRYYKRHGQFVFLSKHGHAWAEIFLKDHGWVVFDTTPATSVPESQAIASGEAPPALEEFLDEAFQDTRKDGGSSLPISWVSALLVCGSGVAVLVALLFFRRGIPKRGGTSLYQMAGDTASPGYLNLFQQACTRLGHPMPTGRTLSQHLESLRHEDVSIGFADDLLSYHYDTTYRNRPRDSRTEKDLSHQIKAWD